MADFDQLDTFETGWGNWDNTGGDHDWTRTNSATPSSNTGADAAYAGSYYVFTEVSSPVTNNEEFFLTSNSVNGAMYALSISFYYHAWGDHIDYLAVEVSENGGVDWDTPLWTITSETHTAEHPTDPYDQQIIDLSGYTSSSILIRFRTKTPASDNVYYGDFSLDNIRIYGDYRASYTISGVTKDKNGDVLGSCEVTLFKADTASPPSYTQIDKTTSNATTGAYSFTVYDQDAQYMVYSIKDDTPHVFDATDNTLQGT